MFGVYENDTGGGVLLSTTFLWVPSKFSEGETDFVLIKII